MSVIYINSYQFAAAGGGGGGTPWDPSVASASLWVDFADLSTVGLSGSSITSVTDKSPNNVVFLPTSAGSPTLNSSYLNGLPAAVMNARPLEANKPASYWGFFYQGLYSAFCVYSSSTTSGVAGIYGNNQLFTSLGGGGIGYWGDSNARRMFFVHANNVGQTAASFYTPASSFFSNEITIISVVSNPAASSAEGRAVIIKNGGTSYSGNTSANAYTSSPPQYPQLFQIGGPGGTGANRGQVTLCELFFLGANVDVDTRRKAEGYLAHKWGLIDNLPASHPYKSVPPTA